MIAFNFLILICAFINEQVIGAKKGGHTTRQLMEIENMNVLKEVTRVLNISFKFIHVVRNPYDNIATMLLRVLKKRDEANLGVKVNTLT